MHSSIYLTHVQIYIQPKSLVNTSRKLTNYNHTCTNNIMYEYTIIYTYTRKHLCSSYTTVLSTW